MPSIPAFLSGGTLVERDRVVSIYPGIGIGSPTYMPGVSAAMMVATSSDPLLLNWKKSAPVQIPAYDPDIWKQGDTYYAVAGDIDQYYQDASVGSDPFKPNVFQKFYGVGVWAKWRLWASKDLKDWKSAGDLLFEKTPFSDRYDDGACPNFQKIGDKYIMLYFSHTNGGQYLLGDYDEANAKFGPYEYGRFNHGQVAPGGVHAPSAATDQNGDVINILTINAAKPTVGWDQIMSLPQRLSLDADKRLKVEPIETVASLRGAHRQMSNAVLAANEEFVLDNISGNAMELDVEIDPQDTQQVKLDVLRSPDAQERTSIVFFNNGRKENVAASYAKQEIVLDRSESSILSDVTPRSPERAELNKEAGETLKLRIFIDRSVVEVFANGKQYLAMRVYPGRKDSLGVSLKARGGRPVLKSMDAWQMKPIWPVADVARRAVDMRLKSRSLCSLSAHQRSAYGCRFVVPAHDGDAELEKTTSVRSAGDRAPRNAVEFDQLYQQIKSWGRWGPEGQLGAANLVTEEKWKQALALAKLGIVLGLGHPLSAGTSGDKTSPFEHTMMDWGFTTEPLVGFTGDTYKITYHGSLTSHFDALCHVAYKGRTYNGYLVKEVYSEKSCTKLGVENLKNGIVTRGVLIDLPRLKRIPYLEPGTGVFAEDIEAWEKYAGVGISAGDAIFLRTGQWVRQAKIGPTNELAGVHPSVATWLKNRGVAFVGSDAGFELVPSPVEGVPYPVHVLAISALGIAIFDALDLEDLSAFAAELHRWEFLYSVGPMNVPGGTGSPVNPVAIF